MVALSSLWCCNEEPQQKGEVLTEIVTAVASKHRRPLWAELDDLLVPTGSIPTGPQDISVRTYVVSPTEVKTDALLHAGSVQHLKLGKTKEGMLKATTYGFVFEGLNPGKQSSTEVSVSWSPFVVLERCTRWATFRVTILRHSEAEEIHEFITVGKNAAEQREKWLQVMSNAVIAVTSSLFPPHVIAVSPLSHLNATCTRIMAGYLVLCEASDCVALLYCELRSFSHGEASFAVYRDESCEVEVAVLQITENTVIRSCSGMLCNIFGLGRLRFCARSDEEAELWIRAIMNVKTKLMCDAPDPGADELAVFREAVRKRISELPNIPRKAAYRFQNKAMLPLRPRQPAPACLLGDVWSPDPLDDAQSPQSNPSDTVKLKFANGERQSTRQLDCSTINCPVLALVGVAAASLVGVADEFGKGDAHPCDKLSETTHLRFGLP